MTRAMQPTGRARRAPAVKFTPELKRELLEAKLARAGNGSPLAAIYYHQLGRFLKGIKPAGSLEEKIFDRLKERDKLALIAHLGHWDKLPAEARKTLLGKAASQLSPRQSLTNEMAKKLVPWTGTRQLRQTAVEISDPITQIQVREIQCVDPTPEIGKDDVFVFYVIVSGDVLFDKITGIYKFKRKNELRGFQSSDINLWTPPDGAPVRNDVEILAQVIEDDKSDIDAVIEVLKSATDVAAPLIEVFGGVVLPEGLEGEFKEFLDAVAAALPQNDLIGSDSVRVLAAGRFLKSSMTATQRRKNGKVRAQYVLKGFRLFPLQTNSDEPIP